MKNFFTILLALTSAICAMAQEEFKFEVTTTAANPTFAETTFTPTGQDIINVMEIPDNDIQITEATFPYTRIPILQAGLLPFPSQLSAKAYNGGLNTQNNIVFSVSYNGTVLGSSLPVSSLAPSATSAAMTVTPPAGTVFPTALGTNNVKYWLTQNDPDENPDDNSITRSFDITNDTYSLDYLGTDASAFLGAGGADTGCKIGNIFTISKTTVLKQVQFAFSVGTFDIPFVLVIQPVTAVTSTYATMTNTYLVEQTGITRPAAGGWVNVNLNTPYTLSPGMYFVGLRQTTTTNIGLATDKIAGGSVCYYVGNATGTNISPYPNFGACGIRMVMATHTIQSTAGANGTITPYGAVSVNSGMDQTFTITPNPCYQVDSVRVNGAKITLGPGNTYTFTGVVANHTIEAFFKNIKHTIVSSAGTGGTISPNGTNTFNECSNVTFNFYPNPGYHVWNILVDGISNPAAIVNGYHTFTNLSAAHTINVTFSNSNTYKLLFNAAPQTYQAMIDVTYGTAIGTLPNPTPPAGLTLGGWFIGTTQITETTIWNYTANQIAVAKWIPVDYTLNLDAGAGTVTPTSMIVHYDSLVGPMPIPIYANYIFSGWFTETNGTGTQIQATTIWNTLGGGTVYAKWTETLGIEDIFANSIIIYPNPTNYELKITNYDGEIKNVEICDLAGRTVGATLAVSEQSRTAVAQMQNAQRAGASPAPTGTATINVSALPQGIYFVKIYTDKGVVIKRFVKM